MLADIITIGDEILIGQVVDTNSAYLAERLDYAGIRTRKIHSISDTTDAIINTLDESIKESDLVILTGGLGPTDDDITKATLRKYFGGEFIPDPVATKFIEMLHERRGLALTARNLRQAKVPSSCKTLRNRAGAAPGMLFHKNNTIIVSLPGVPYEMKNIYEQELLPFLEKEFLLPVRLKRTLLTFGMGESLIADKIAEWERALPEKMALAYLPSVTRLRLRLSISGTNRDELKKILNDSVSELKNQLGDDIVYGYDDDTLESVVGDLLRKTSRTISVAESCTGGTISQMIASVPGASGYFKGGVTTYANTIKQQILRVSETDLNTHGAVSEQVVGQMAVGVRELMNTDYSIATSGIAGPGGGTEEKPVGTIWIAIASKDKLISRKFVFSDHRGRNIERTSVTALNMLRNIIRKEL